MIIRVIEPVYKIETYAEYEKLGETVRCLNAYLGNGKMDLGMYKSIINRKLGFNIPKDDADSRYGFVADKLHDTFYSEVTSWFDENGNETEIIGKILYRSL